mmetsp:Transcript_19953/g.42008  ORF Transcript_19953/g.42008 Transcript_19953/m.42008 type:complete len:86 (-) Transcript_19953:1736-1993(-)
MPWPLAAFIERMLPTLLLTPSRVRKQKRRYFQLWTTLSQAQQIRRDELRRLSLWHKEKHEAALFRHAKLGCNIFSPFFTMKQKER